MMYPYLTLNDDTEITHSEMKPDGSVKVYIETPDERDGFHNATCWLPKYKWEDINGYSEAEMDYFRVLIRNNAHLLLEFSRKGGLKDVPLQTPRKFGSPVPEKPFCATTPPKFLHRNSGNICAL